MSNNDNAMTRFLFAILKQKNLKDIDWNAVARDPILSQEITNGHAARMRYSRFRQAMLGLEPKPRNKTVAAEKDKHRITKSKKAPKPKREEMIKHEPAMTPSNTRSPSEPPTPKIKQEMAQSPYNSRLTPGPVSAASSPALPHVIQPRLLTPCSDTDGYSTTAQGLTPSPATDMFSTQPPFDFAATHYGHDPTPWPPGPMFPSFHTTFEFDPVNLTCGYPHMHAHADAPHHSHGPAENEESGVGVKHEAWDDHCA
ncbi:hypothetical protein PG997_000610 [Apiospora hydei]|uniref:Myb-like DNA-binding domain-containing protein n=1 Tax=Apiospora hydei TaxID=1337664 RepID=A0ABR1XB58_9PEZI